MARIFTYPDIQFGKVPEAEDFERATEVFVKLTEGVISDGAIDGGFIYGSVASGSAGPRSDFDPVLALNGRHPEAYLAARAVICCVREETGYKIPIVPIVQTKEALASGRHEMDRLFGQHLTSPHRLVCGNDPATYMSFADKPIHDLLADYLFQKKRRLTNTYTAADVLNVEEGGLQRMLELPQAVGRKALQALAEIGYLPETLENSADKISVSSKSRKLFEGMGIVGGFDRLTTVNQNYDTLLTDAQYGRIDVDGYNDFLRGLHAELPQAIGWIEQVEVALLPLFTTGHGVRLATME